MYPRCFRARRSALLESGKEQWNEEDQSLMIEISPAKSTNLPRQKKEIAERSQQKPQNTLCQICFRFDPLPLENRIANLWPTSG